MGQKMNQKKELKNGEVVVERQVMIMESIQVQLSEQTGVGVNYGLYECYQGGIGKAGGSERGPHLFQKETDLNRLKIKYGF